MTSALLAALALFAQETTTTEVRRIVGEPLSAWVLYGSGLALLVAILVAGLVARSRSRSRSRSDAGRPA